jgi:hypothetical protein
MPPAMSRTEAQNATAEADLGLLVYGRADVNVEIEIISQSQLRINIMSVGC